MISSGRGRNAWDWDSTPELELLGDPRDDVVGHGPLEAFLRDPSVTEVVVNGPNQIYVERDGRIEATSGRFRDEGHLRQVIERIVAEAGHRIDDRSPVVDARLPDGARLDAVYPCASTTGPYLTIRKLPYTPRDGGLRMISYERSQDPREWVATPPLLDDVRHRIHRGIVERLGGSFDGLPGERLEARVESLIEEALRTESTPLSAVDKLELLEDLKDDILGHGPLEAFLRDPSVTEVMVNGPNRIYIERDGRIEATSGRFRDEEHLRRVIERIVAAVGRRIDDSSPMVDARLPDGSRVNAVYPPLSTTGPYLTIRKFPADPLSADDLQRMGTLTGPARSFLESCVLGHLNILVSGGTGAGKTTLLNVLSSFLPADERIVTIEDAKELQLHQAHVLSLESRPSNSEGRGEVTIRDLVRNALRMRPDRIIVGEVRAGEALDMLQAMNTGHEGSLTTVHANSPRDALARVETLTLMAGIELPVRAIRDQMASALDLIVHLSRLRDGTRRVTHVTEVERMEGDVIVLQDLFLFDFGMGVDEQGRYLGTLKSTGLRPKFADRLEDRGVRVPAEIFQTEGFFRAPIGRR